MKMPKLSGVSLKVVHHFTIGNIVTHSVAKITDLFPKEQ
jgi:hypothetical protein